MRSILITLWLCAALPVAAAAADEPDLIFKKTTVWFLSPDQARDLCDRRSHCTGVACHFTVPENGGWTGWAVSPRSDRISLACRQVGPIDFKAKFEQGHEMYRLAAPCSLKRCRSFAAAILSATCWSMSSIRIKLIEGARKTRPPPCRSCLGAPANRSAARNG